MSSRICAAQSPEATSGHCSYPALPQGVDPRGRIGASAKGGMPWQLAETSTSPFAATAACPWIHFSCHQIVHQIGRTGCQSHLRYFQRFGVVGVLHGSGDVYAFTVFGGCACISASMTGRLIPQDGVEKRARGSRLHGLKRENEAKSRSCRIRGSFHQEFFIPAISLQGLV